MRLRIRGPTGVSTITLEDCATVADLRREITKSTTLDQFEIKYSDKATPLLFVPLVLPPDDTPLSDLDVKLNHGDQLIVSEKSVSPRSSQATATPPSVPSNVEKLVQSISVPKFAGMTETSNESRTSSKHTYEDPKPIPLKKKKMAEDTPELPLPDRGATLVVRVMPDDNSCMFRAFASAVLPGDDLSMPELRSLVATVIQSNPQKYTKVILDNRDPDDYCRWLQTEDAWGGAIELTILSEHFDIEICSIDVQSLRIDRFNEDAPMRCILVYSGIHYDTIAQSPSDPPHKKADSPPEFDKKVWDKDDDDILFKAQELCKILQGQHYFTDTGGMAIKCQVCGWVGYGEGQASTHAQQSGHYDMAEVTEAEKK